MKAAFNIDKFYEFAATVTIATKELGKIRMNKENMLGSQIYFIEEVAKGLNEGIHEFYILKGRQVAVTTATLLLDMFWLGKHEGLTGSFVTHDETARDMFRVTFDQIAESTRPPFKVSFEINNRTQMVTTRGDNRLLYMVAGTRKNSKLGKGSALTFAHLTEESEYGDEEGLASLKSTFAQENPNRLFIHESTAQGYNHWYDSWLAAKASTTKRAIFVGWWRNGFYRKKKGSPEYTVYWDGRHTPEERKWVREIEQIYDYKIDDEQIAWWRWNLAEETKDELLMFQNYPPTEHYAFVKSGSQFFSGARINDEFKLANATKPINYRFVLKDGFEDTELIESSERMQNLKVWQLPEPGGYYAIGADPAWGSSEWKDRFVCQVYRCYSDGMEQVAEFCTPDCSPYQFAWVICYLGGAYLSQPGANAMLNLELNGPGMAVWQEILNLKRMSIAAKTDAGKKIFKVVQNLQSYMYKRHDSFGGATGFHTVSNTREKERMLTLFRDGFERNIIKVNSTGCIDEMRRVERDEGFIGAPDREKDDRVIASCLSTTAWADYLLPRLMSAKTGGLTRAASVENIANAGKWTPTGIATFLRDRMRT
jgi:hypothetical protein